MALRETGDGTTVDTEDPEEVAAWTRRRAQTAVALAASRRVAASLVDRLNAPDAVAARAELEAARAALRQAQGDATSAQARFDAADGDARRYEANDVADAQAALDAATFALSQALAELLREASTSASLTAGVDGLALRERYRAATATTPRSWDHTTIPFPATDADVIDPELALPAVGSSDGSYARLLAVLDRLEERVDAVADLVTAESAHQLVQGNPTRAGGSLAVAAQGRVPDEFDVIRTPRSGHDIGHRFLVLTDPNRPAAWSVAAPGPAASVDSLTARWVAGLLPDPATVGLAVRFEDSDGAQVGPTVEVRLDGLGLDPLGWVRVAAVPAELDARVASVATAAWMTAAGPDADPTAVTPAWAAVSPLHAGEPSLTDLLATAKAVGRVLAQARALEPADLAAPTAAEVPSLPASAAEDVAARVRALETWTDDLAAALTAAAQAPGDLDTLRRLLLDAASAGVAEAVTPVAGQTVALLATLAGPAAARLRRRHAQQPFSADPADPAGTLTRARARADELSGMRVPLAVAQAAPFSPSVAVDLGVGGRLAGATPEALRDGARAHASVRPAVGAALAAYDLAEALGGEPLRLRVTQLPERDGDVWVGSVADPLDGTTALLVQAAYGATLPAQVSGLVVDAWTQAVPLQRHDTGLAVHYDQPDAAPPQAVLVAVHPDPNAGTGTWDLDTVLDVVTSTLALARDRATAAELRPVAGLEVHDA